MKEIFKRANQYLLFVILAVVILHYGRIFLIPLVFAAMLAMLMAPVCRKLDKLGLNRALSSFACIFILILVIAGIGAIVGSQFAAFAEDANVIEEKAKDLVANVQVYIEEKLGMSAEKQQQAIKQQVTGAAKSVGGTVAKFLAGLTTTIGGMVVTLVFTFLFIYNKEKYEEFFLRLYRGENQQEVKKVVGKISDVAQRYLTGRAMSITIIAVMYSIGLSIVGIKNAILLAGIAALLTIIPYVGTVLGGMFPVMMALLTEDSTQPAFLAVVVMFTIQTIDNYFIEPNIVGGEVSLNALTSIISIIAGGMIWGVAGMILFLPMAGILKIVCDHVESLKPIGFVIGDPDAQKPSKLKLWIFNKLGLKTKKTS